MASNNYTSANIVPSADTFREWVDLTNRITYDMEKYVVSTTLTAEGACTTGNSFVNGHFSANTLRVVDVIMGASPNSTVFGTEAVTSNLLIGTNTVFVANDTHDSIIYAQSNVFLVNTGVAFVANATGGFVTINSTVNTFTSNAQTIDINADSLDIQDGEVTISSNVTVNSTATVVRFDANTDINANVDIDNALTTITSSNTVIENGQLNITSNVNIDAASVDIEDGELTVSSNVTVNSTATVVRFDANTDINANVDIDNALTTITSSNTFIENGELNVDSNTVFTANINVTADSEDFNIGSDVVTINTSTTTFQSNAGTNLFNTKIDANANVDIDNALTTITSANTVVENGEFNITSNVNFDAASFDIAGGLLNVSSNVTINSTANTFTSNAGTNVFNTKIDANANVDIDNALTTITSSNTVVENGEFNITSNVNFDAASFDILAGAFNVTQSNSTTHSINIDPTTNTFTSNAGLNIFNTPLDINANIDVDNTTTDFNSTNFIVTGTTANVTSTTMNIHGTTLDVNSNTRIDGNLYVTSANVTVGDANSDTFTVNSNTILTDKLNVNGAVDLDSTLNVDGDVTLQANTTVGSNTLDGVAINARVTTGILPYGNSTVSNTNLLGNSIARWVISANTLNASGDITGGADLDITSEANTNTLRVRTTSELTGAVNANTSVTTGNVVITRTQIAVGNSSANVVISQNGDISTDGKIDVDANTDANSTAASIVTEGGLLVKKKSYLTGDVSAAANVTVDGTTVLKGNVDLGDSTTNDTVTFTSKVDSDIVPYGNATNSNTNVLGASDARWVIYANTLGTSGDITVGGDIDAADSKQANVYDLIVRNDGTVNGNLVIGSNTSDVVSFNSLVNTGIVPDGNTRTFGGAASRWATVYGIAGEYSGNMNIDGTLTADQKVTIGANTAQKVAINSQVETNLIPDGNTRSFGNTTNRWSTLFGLAGNITNNLTVGGDATVNGNVVLGSNSSDGVAVNARVTTDVIPYGNATNSNTNLLGNSTARWVISSTTLNASGDITAGADVDVGSQANTNTLRVRSTSAFEGDVLVGNGSVYFSVDESEGDFTATGNGAISGALVVNKKVTIGANTAQKVAINSQVETNLIPDGNTRSFGNGTSRWTISANTINASGTITGAGVNLSGAANVSTLRVRSTSAFEGDVLIGDGNVYFSVDESEGDFTATGTGLIKESLVVGNLNSNTTQTIVVGPAGEDANGDPWGTVTLSSEVTGGKVAAANAQFATLTVTDSASLPSNTTLSIATANTNDLFVFNKAEITGKANGDNYVKIGTTSYNVALNLANASFTTSIFSANTAQNIGSSSSKWGSGYFNSVVQVGSFTSGSSGTQANSTAVESTNIYARADLVAKYTSDKNLKDDLIVIDTAINKVEALNGYEFTWNEKINDFRIGTKDYGIVAQELEQVLPHAVIENENGYKSVNYNSLIPLLIEAVKELSGRLKKLEGDGE